MKRAVEAAAVALVLAAGAVGIAQYVWSDYGPLFGASWWLGVAVIVAAPALVVVLIRVHPAGADPWNDDA